MLEQQNSIDNVGAAGIIPLTSGRRGPEAVDVRLTSGRLAAARRAGRTLIREHTARGDATNGERPASNRQRSNACAADAVSS